MATGDVTSAGTTAERRARPLLAVAGVAAVLGVVAVVAVLTAGGEEASPYAEEDTFLLITDIAATTRDLPHVRLEFETRATRADRELVAAGELVVDGTAQRSRFQGVSYGTAVEQVVVGTSTYLRIGDEPGWWRVDVEHARDMLEPVAPVLSAGVTHGSLRGTASLDPVVLVGTGRHRGVRVSEFHGWALFAEPIDPDAPPQFQLGVDADRRPELFHPTHQMWVDDHRRIRRMAVRTIFPGGFRVEGSVEIEPLRETPRIEPPAAEDVLEHRVLGTQAELAALLAEQLEISLDHLPG